MYKKLLLTQLLKLNQYLLWSLYFLLSLIIYLVIRKILINKLSKIANNTSSQIDNIIIEAVKIPSIIWGIALCFYFTIDFHFPQTQFLINIEKLVIIIIIISISIVIAKIVSGIIKLYSDKFEEKLPVTSLTQNVSKIFIYLICTLIILNYLKISITPILTTLGIGGIAIALALQDTLSNFFAGFHIIIARQIKVGNYIKLESGEEGYVIDITWRNTKIKMLTNNELIIPNEKLSKSIIVNYNLPDKEMYLVFQYGVHYNSDLEKVEQVTKEVAKEVIKEINGCVKEYEPLVRYHTLADSSINLSVIVKIRDIPAQFLFKHNFIKKIMKRYAAEGIVIPYPIRAINFTQEQITKE